ESFVFPLDPVPAVEVSRAVPTHNWTGIYLGLNGGYAFGGSSWTDSVTATSSGNFGTSGFVFGGTLGGDYQIGSLLFGIEGDQDWSNTSGFGTFTSSPLCTGGCLTGTTWLGTLRGRLGYAFNRVLVYGTAGGAWGDVRANYSNGAISGSIEPGWTAGAGV